MPAAFARATRLLVDVVKNAITGSSSNDGEFVTSPTPSSVLQTAPPTPHHLRTLPPAETPAPPSSYPPPRRRSPPLFPIRPLAPSIVHFIFNQSLPIISCLSTHFAGPSQQFTTFAT